MAAAELQPGNIVTLSSKVPMEGGPSNELTIVSVRVIRLEDGSLLHLFELHKTSAHLLFFGGEYELLRPVYTSRSRNLDEFIFNGEPLTLHSTLEGHTDDQLKQPFSAAFYNGPDAVFVTWALGGHPDKAAQLCPVDVIKTI